MLCLAQEHDMVTQQGLKPVSFNPDSRAPTVRLPLPHSLELIIDVHAKLKYWILVSALIVKLLYINRCIIFFLGTFQHELTSHTAFDSIFKFFEEKLSQKDTSENQKDSSESEMDTSENQAGTPKNEEDISENQADASHIKEDSSQSPMDSPGNQAEEQAENQADAPRNKEDSSQSQTDAPENQAENQAENQTDASGNKEDSSPSQTDALEIQAEDTQMGTDS